MSRRSDSRNGRGYFGIGIYQPKTATNIGVLWRSAHALDADFIFSIQARFPDAALPEARQAWEKQDRVLRQRGNTVKAHRHLPYFRFESVEALRQSALGCQLVVIEQDVRSKALQAFCHPERAVYLLGAEDNGFPEEVLAQADAIVEVASRRCLNVSVAGSILIYDRATKRN